MKMISRNLYNISGMILTEKKVKNGFWTTINGDIKRDGRYKEHYSFLKLFSKEPIPNIHRNISVQGGLEITNKGFYVIVQTI